MQDNNLVDSMYHLTIMLNFELMPPSQTRTQVTWAYILSYFNIIIRITRVMCVLWVHLHHHDMCILCILCIKYYQLEAACTKYEHNEYKKK